VLVLARDRRFGDERLTQLGDAPGEGGELVGTALERDLAGSSQLLPALEGCTSELDRAEVATTILYVRLRPLELLCPSSECRLAGVQLPLAAIELGRLVPQQLLDVRLELTGS
jgi:hypothetical protein